MPYIRKTTSYNVPWSVQEETTLARLYPAAAKDDVLDALPERTWGQICNRACKLRVPRSAVTWSAAEEALMREHYPQMGGAKLGQQLGRSQRSVCGKAQSMKLAYAPKHPPRCRAFIGPRLPTKGQQYAAEVARRKEARAKAREDKPRHHAPTMCLLRRKPPVQHSMSDLIRNRREFSPTPNLAVQKALIAKKKAVVVSVTAEEIRALKPNDPQRRIYAIGGRAAVEAYRSQLQAA
jgi:hypothetical protein